MLAAITAAFAPDDALRLVDAVQRAGLIDLDGTVLVQGAFFLILMIVLPRIIFRPMLERIEQREARTEGARNDARSMRRAADEQVLAYERATAEEKRRALAERSETRNATQRMAADLVTTARHDTTARIDQGLAAQRQHADVVRQQLAREAETISLAIADKLAAG